MVLAGVGLAALSACSDDGARQPPQAPAAEPAGRLVVVRATTIPAVLEAAGIAEPVQRATLSTRLMGAVTAVLAHEGQAVRAGQVLARIDARDLAAREQQARAGVAEAEAIHRDAVTQAGRFQALYADSAATRAQLDAAETGLARAEAGVRAARGAAREVDAMTGYAELRAPFAGVVTQRFVDPGAFVAPGSPVVAVQDGSRLRITVTVAPAAAAGLRPGMPLKARIEHATVDAVVEGVAPASAGALYTVNAIVSNARGQLPVGGAAMLRIPQGTRTGMLVPLGALVREGDLTGVRIRAPGGLELRWVRLGLPADSTVEVLSGLRDGDTVFVARSAVGGR